MRQYGIGAPSEVRHSVQEGRSTITVVQGCRERAWLAAASSRMGMWAAMPPIACTPRLWQVLITSSVYDRMQCIVMPTSDLRIGSKAIRTYQ